MGFSDRYKDSVYYHYSPTFKYSLGIEAIAEKLRDSDHAYARATYLLNRKKTKFNSLLKIRGNFLPELFNSIDNL